MEYKTFLDLYEILDLTKILEESLNEVIGGSLETHQHVPNGRISKSVRLACALRYFAGGSPYNIMCKYGVSHSNIF